MTGPKGTLAEGRQRLGKILDQLEAVRWQLIDLKLNLPEPPKEQGRLEDMGDEVDAITELRTTIECVLEDSIRPALQDLQDVLENADSKDEEP